MGGCSNPLEGGRALAGCTAVATAQVMKYHQYPSSYAWNSMPNTDGAYATASLLREIGNVINMNYTCTGSFKPTSAIVPALENYFGYSTSATYANYTSTSYVTVRSELNNNRPVILSGTDARFGNYGGHTWVCDGYIAGYYCAGFNTLHFHMNWGFYYGSCNGYYAFNLFNPNYTENYVFNSDLKMVTGINHKIIIWKCL